MNERLKPAGVLETIRQRIADDCHVVAGLKFQSWRLWQFGWADTCEGASAEQYRPGQDSSHIGCRSRTVREQSRPRQHNSARCCEATPSLVVEVGAAPGFGAGCWPVCNRPTCTQAAKILTTEFTDDTGVRIRKGEAGSKACSRYPSCLALRSLHVPTAQSPDVSLCLRTEQRLRTRGGLAMGPADGPVSRRDGADASQQSPGDRV